MWNRVARGKIWTGRLGAGVRRRLLAMMLALAAVAVMTAMPVRAETRTVVTEGKTDVCFSRQEALKLAHIGASNDGRSACYGLGKGWRFSKLQFAGYEQCFRCGKSEEFRCKVTQAVFVCENTEKEEKAAKEKAAAKARAEKEARDREAKAKADAAKANKSVAPASPVPTKPTETAARKPPESKPASAPEAKRPAQPDKPDSHSPANLLDGAPSAGKGSSSIGRLMDETAERPLVRKRLDQEKSAYRPAAEEACRGVMRTVDACYARTDCRRPAESPSQDECKAIPPYPESYGGPVLTLTRTPQPGEVCYRVDAECLAVRTENERRNEEERRARARRIEQKQAEWHSRYGRRSDTCKQRDKERADFAKCQKQYAGSCNPSGFEDQKACVESRMATHGPNEKSVRSTLQKEWDASERGPRNGKSGKDAGQPHNFLD